MAQYIRDDCLHVLLLVATLGERAGVHRFRFTDLEEERARGLVTVGLIPAIANCGKRATDERTDDFVQQSEAVALVRAEWDQVLRLRRVRRGLARFVNRGIWRQLFAFTRELLHPSHGHDRSRP